MKAINIYRPRSLFVAAMVSAAAIAAGCGGCANVAPVAQAQAASTPWPGGTWTPGEANYGSGLDTGISVTMSDGVILTADISYPTDRATGTRAAGPFPVLLTQTPYKFLDSKAGDCFVERGYIYVTAHVRGTLTSGGSFAWLSAVKIALRDTLGLKRPAPRESRLGA